MQYTQQEIDNTARGTLKMIRANFFYLDELKVELHHLREERMVSCLAEQVKVLNSRAGSRRRKSLSGVTQVLSARGISWRWCGISQKMQEILEVMAGGHSYFLTAPHGISLALEYRDQRGCLSFFHCTATEEAIVDFILFISAVDRRSQELFERKCLECHRDQMLSDIELPSVELEAARFLEPRGIRYRIDHINGCNRLKVHIVNNIWMVKDVTIETLEDDLQIIPYLIKRPDCISQDGRGFKIMPDWTIDL